MLKDAEIIELDDEPEEVAAPWRPGSLSIVAAPMIVVLLIVSAIVWNAGRSSERSTDRVIVTASSAPSSAAGEIVFSLPTPIIATRPPAVLTFNGETGDPEILAEFPWLGLGPTYPARGDVAEAVLYGDAYVIGGTGSSTDGRLVYRYDRRTGMRMSVAELPISLDHAMAATLRDRIFVFGGFVFGRPSARVFSLGSNDTDWVEHSPMPAPRAAGGAAVIDDRVYLIGGVGADGNGIRETWTYDARGRWNTTLAPIPTPRDHLAVGTYKGSICAAGGNGGEQAFECYDPVRNVWTKLPPLRKPAIGARAVEAGGRFWVIAQDVHVYAADRWQFGPRLLTPRAGHAVVVIDGAIYVLEGALGGATVRSEFIPSLR